MAASRARVARPDQPCVIAGIALAIASALEHAGVNSAQVFARAGLARQLSNDPLQRLSANQVSALYSASVATTCDPYFGLKVARCIQPSNLHVLGYTLIASASQRDFCQKLVRFLGVASQSAHAELQTGADTIELRFHHRVRLCGQSEDAFLAFLVRLLRVMRSEHFTPLAVHLHHACPRAGAEPYTALFGVRPQFDSVSSALVFSPLGADVRLIGACAELATVSERLAGDYLARLNAGDLSETVRTTVMGLLPTGSCTRARVATQLGMSESTLHAKLAKCGNSFNDIVDALRKDLAISLLSQSGLPVTGIAFDLGFTETGNFTRAFKRWTGQSPTAFRAARNAMSPQNTEPPCPYPV